MNRYLLCTDLDRTLIPNGAQPASPLAHERFRQLVERPEITLTYVSGRHRALIEQAIVEYDLPVPDYAIADVGSTLYQIDAHGWQQWAAWDAHIAPDWAGLNHAALAALLADFPTLRLQETEKQNHHKLSYYVDLNHDAQALMAGMQARLQQAGVHANLIWSIDEPAQVGLLDVLPARANKLHAIEFLMQQQGYPLSHTVFAGDSGNDLDVLLSHLPAILVANADDEVRQRCQQAAPDTLYLAHGDYLGMNGNYSAGILEGLAHYWPQADTWLRAMEQHEG